MSKQNNIKVFLPNSKKADYIVRHIHSDKVAKKAGEMLGADAEAKVAKAFASLRAIGADSLSFRLGGRKIKVEAALAA